MSFLVMLLGILPRLTASQETTPQPGFIVVRTVDVADAALPGVQVTATAQGSRAAGAAPTTTNSKGEARIGPLPDGVYEIRCELSSFEADYSALVPVSKRRPARVVIVMSFAPFEHYRIEPQPSVTPPPIMKLTPRQG